MLIRLVLLCAIVAILTVVGGATAHAATHAVIGDRLTRAVLAPTTTVTAKPPKPARPDSGTPVTVKPPKPELPDPEPPVTVTPPKPEPADPEPPVTVTPPKPEPPDPEPPVTVKPPKPKPPDPEPPVTVAPKAPPVLATAHRAASPQAATQVAQPSAPRSRRVASATQAANSRVPSPSSASRGSSMPATEIGSRPRGHRDVRRAITGRLQAVGDSMLRVRPERPVGVDRRRTAMAAVPLAAPATRLKAQNDSMPRLATSDRGNGVPLWSVVGFLLLVIGLRTLRPADR
jgi:hypothetical protein